jgi:hypothetical protein
MPPWCPILSSVERHPHLMTDAQTIQSKLDELHEQFNTLQSQGATNSELNSVRRELNIYYEMLRKLG